jgi:hypothetical protein
MTSRVLYTWNWNEGGFNQTHATSKKDALAQIKKVGGSLTVNLKTLKRNNKAQEKAYWKWFPSID